MMPDGTVKRHHMSQPKRHAGVGEPLQDVADTGDDDDEVCGSNAAPAP